MVKKGTILGPPGLVKKDGTPRRRPGRHTLPEDVKTERLVLRMHPDIVDILSLRARERGVSRSKYLEDIVVGWVSADPRNPKVDSIGKLVPDAVPPELLLAGRPLRFAEMWTRFSQLSQMLIGVTPKEEWLDELDERARRALAEQGREPYSAPDPEVPDPAVARWAAGVKDSKKDE